MNAFPSIWRFALALIGLFVIAAFAAHSTIAFLIAEFPGQPDLLRAMVIAIWSLTMGFMFLAGGLGLWGIRTAGEMESLRRIGQLVSSMDFMNDGLVAVTDHSVIGANPAARAMGAGDYRDGVPLTEYFPSLDDEDLAVLTGPLVPSEVERERLPDAEGNVITYRFRSQSGGGTRLIMISDVTDIRARQAHMQQLAQRQLIGRITEGAAHDFNNILCVVSGHASLLSRLQLEDESARASLAAIRNETQRGAQLASQLLELSRSGMAGAPTSQLGHHLEVAANLLRVGLAESWSIETKVDADFPVVSLTGSQIEQITVKLGILSADTLGQPGVLRIAAMPPNESQVLHMTDRYAAVILISAAAQDASAAAAETMTYDVHGESDEVGAILSVVRSVLSQAGGRLDRLEAANGQTLFHLAVPYGSTDQAAADVVMLPAELRAYIAHWHVLLAFAEDSTQALGDRLNEVGTRVEVATSVGSVLARIEEHPGLDAVVIDAALLGPESESVLRAIGRLAPGAGIVVLTEDEASDIDRPLKGIMSVIRHDDPVRIMGVMFEARGLAHRYNEVPPG